MKPSFEQLLGHGDFVRAIARRLLRDDAAAEDVAQETYALALRRPPGSQWSPRAWLAGVARNLSRRRLREESRRRAREMQAARGEPVRSTADVVVHEEIRHNVVAAVLSLDEPYRGVVLLRFFDGLSAKDIAVRLSIPAATVRSHLRRALAHLRGRLERRHGRAWGAALLPLVRPAVMSSKSVLPVAVVAALAVLLAAVLWWDWGNTSKPPGRPGRAGASAGAGAPSPGPASPLGSAANPGAIGAAGVVLRLEPAAAQELELIHESDRTRTLRTDGDGRAKLSADWVGETVIWVGARKVVRQLVEGENTIRIPPGAPVGLRFVDEHGELLPPETVRQRFQRAGTPQVALVDRLAFDGGRVFRALFGTKRRWRRESAVTWGGPGAVLDTRVGSGLWSIVIDWPGSAPMLVGTLATDGASAATVSVPLAPVREVRVRLLAADTRAPLVGAHVSPRLMQSGFEYAGRTRVSDDRGEVVLPLANGVFIEWWIETPTHALGLVGDDVAKSQAVDVPRRGHVEGRAYRSDGSPAVGALVVLGRAARTVRTTVRDDGSYRLRGVPARPDNSIALVEDVGARRLQLTTVGVKPGQTVRADLGRVPGKAALLVRILVPGRETGLELMAVSANRVRPRRGAVAREADRNGRTRTTVRTDSVTVHPDRAGVARLTGLEAGSWRISVGLGDMRIAWDEYGLFGRAGEALVEVVPGEASRRLEFTLPRGALRVRVTDARGRPVPGAAVKAHPRDLAPYRDRYAGYEFKPGWAAYTSRNGEALLIGLPVDAVHDVTVRAPGFAPAPGIRGVATESAPVVSVVLKPRPTLGKPVPVAPPR